jgi:hypothetical protein
MTRQISFPKRQSLQARRPLLKSGTDVKIKKNFFAQKIGEIIGVFDSKR